MEVELSTQMGRFFHPMFANCVHAFTDVRSCLEKDNADLKCSSGHVECSFDKPAETLSQKTETFSLKVQKIKNYYFNFFKKKFPQNVLLET